MSGVNREKVLVTGSTGFTGSHLTRQLIADGYTVRIIVRNGKKAQEMFQGLAVEILEGDFRDISWVKESVKGVSKVFHIAALFRQAGLPDEDYWFINRTLPIELALASLKEGVQKFIHCSTIGVHGHIEQVPGNENSPIKPGDIYQLTKWEGEKEVRKLSETLGLPLTVIRPCGIYGPGDMRFLKLFKMIKRRRFFMIGRGKTLWHPVYIDDLVAGIIQSSKLETHGQVLIIGGPEYLELNRLVELIAKAVGVSTPTLKIPYFPIWALAVLCENLCKILKMEPPLHRRRVDFFVKTRSFETKQAQEVMNFVPQIHIEEGIQRTAHWYQQMGYL